jgi:hypothetical protein
LSKTLPQGALALEGVEGGDAATGRGYIIIIGPFLPWSFSAWKSRCPDACQPKKERSTMGTALFIIVYLTNGITGANMMVTQCYVPEMRVFSSHLACQTALQNVLTQAAANMKVNAVCMDL